jgi:sugar lactone lactonase YvrE
VVKKNPPTEAPLAPRSAPAPIWLALCLACGFAAVTQAASPTQGPGVQSARDAREPQVLATCKHPPTAAPQGPPPGFKPPTGVAVEYRVSGIDGVIAADARWTQVFAVDGNNADGIVGLPDGTLLIAQNDASKVVKLDVAGHPGELFADTNTGGALSQSKRGDLFIVQRGLYPAVWQLSPQRRLLANKYRDDPLDCLGSVINDLSADSHGGVYFTDGGVFYADAHGVITQYGADLRTNGIILSANEHTLYVTNLDAVVAFDVQPDGSLAHQREFAHLPDSGDGLAIDGQGRLYATVPGGEGISVFSESGSALGVIATPFPVISLSFGGARKQILYAVAETGKAPAQAAAILSIPTTARGYLGRPK